MMTAVIIVVAVMVIVVVDRPQEMLERPFRDLPPLPPRRRVREAEVNALPHADVDDVLSLAPFEPPADTGS